MLMSDLLSSLSMNADRLTIERDCSIFPNSSGLNETLNLILTV